jgi:hypothetical protein
MIPPLDVFSVKLDREPEWLGAAETLGKAVELIRASGPGSYFVFSQQTGHKNFFNVSADGNVWSVPDL